MFAKVTFLVHIPSLCVYLLGLSMNLTTCLVQKPTSQLSSWGIGSMHPAVKGAFLLFFVLGHRNGFS